MINRIIENYKTSVLGIVIIGFSLYQIYITNEVALYSPLLLIGIGLLASKDPQKKEL